MADLPLSPHLIKLLLAVLLSQLLAILLTGYASLWICLGLHPESFLLMDWFAPLAALTLTAFLLARRTESTAGLHLALVTCALYLFLWLILRGRFSPVSWWADGLLALTWSHLAWWTGSIILSTAAGFAGHSTQAKEAVPLAIIATLLLIPLAQQIATYRNPEPAAADGTTIRLLRYRLDGLQAGVYDADSDDSHPFDDRNTTYFGQPLPLVWRKLAAGPSGPPDAVVNGGFFGASQDYVAEHEAPIVVNRSPHYNVSTLEDDWPEQAYMLIWRYQGRKLHFRLARGLPFNQLSDFDGALGGVRALRLNGQEFTLKPGMGGSALMTDRTSIGWDQDFLYILSVRDPDGEASSLRDNRAHRPQFGGWDVHQVAAYWKHLRVPNAVLFDGGESTQLGFRDPSGAVQTTHSSYFFTRTPLFIRQRPLRFVYPMLPPYQANGGVLNWFWVKSLAVASTQKQLSKSVRDVGPFAAEISLVTGRLAGIPRVGQIRFESQFTDRLRTNGLRSTFPLIKHKQLSPHARPSPARDAKKYLAPGTLHPPRRRPRLRPLSRAPLLRRQ